MYKITKLVYLMLLIKIKVSISKPINNNCIIPSIEDLTAMYAKFYIENYDMISQVELSDKYSEYNMNEIEKINKEIDVTIRKNKQNKYDHDKFCKYEIEISEERLDKFPRRIYQAKLIHKYVFTQPERYECLPIKISRLVFIQDECQENNYFSYKHEFETVTIGFKIGINAIED